MSKSWTEVSAEWIKAQAEAHPEMDMKTLRKHCSSNYPFMQRSGWAYKAWLKAMRAFFNPQAIRPVRRGKIQPSADELESRGQLRLIEEPQ